MAKFSGKIGYGYDIESPPNSGNFKKVLTEREYKGEVIRESRTFVLSNQVNENVTLSNRISIIADDFASTNFPSMIYVVMNGVYWKVTNFEVNRPRLILSLGGVYNGPKVPVT